MDIVIVAAVGRNGAIGINGGLPWRITEDMAHFKELTMGSAVVMGRATFESIGRPLPGRTSIVLTRRTDWS
ncbi:MAG TPA: dihydrofolate reductase, partial [Acidimicrobiia bacterium]|nr:dihydrofolate reductase [Acidimicrobiia bacterium]